MGFCRTMTTSFYYQSWPEWFREKYADDIEFLGSLSLSHEKALGGCPREFEEDIQKAIDWSNQNMPFVVACLHECGAVTRTVIKPDSIEHPDGSHYSHNQSCDPHFGYLETRSRHGFSG